MPLKEITCQASGQVFKMGRRAPLARGPRLSLGNYLLATLPAPPASVDYAPKAQDWLNKILGNDTLGDCTAAGAFHTGGLFLDNAGAANPLTRADVIKFYSATSGYVPGDPSTDQGADEGTVLNYWKAKGLTPGAHQIAGYMAVNPANQTEVEQAMWLFENLYFGVCLPDAWVSPMPSASGFVWDVAGEADPNNGHCVVGVGYDAKGVQVDSWGMIGTITWAAVAKYCAEAAQGDLFTVLGPDSIAKAGGKAASGFDLTQLTADLQAVA